MIVKTFIALLVGAGFWNAALITNNSIAPWFLHSRIDRIFEKDLPKFTVEKGGMLYWRLKTGDYYIKLPAGCHPTLPITMTAGYDSAEGCIDIQFDGTNSWGTHDFDYAVWANSGNIDSAPMRGGVKLHYHFFGDF